MMEQQSFTPPSGLTELVTVLRARAGGAMHHWERAARHTLDNWPDSAILAFRNELAAVVENVSAGIEADGVAPKQPAEPDAPIPGLSPADVVRGFSTLRHILCTEASTALNRPIRGDELLAIDTQLDRIVHAWVSIVSTAHLSRTSTDTEAQRKLLSFLSHDLRGGLNGVFLMIEIVKRELAPHAQFADSMEDLDGARRSMLDTLTTLDRYIMEEKRRRAAAAPSAAATQSVVSQSMAG